MNVLHSGLKLGGYCALFFVFLVLPGCGRKDVNRAGDIKLRGERAVNIERKRLGDPLQKGIASWYGIPYHGRKTSNGETYNMDAMTAAHKTLPFNTYVKVVDEQSGRFTHVRINDRGPFVRGRIIDLSRAAARELGIFNKGVTQVRLYLADAHPMDRPPKANRVRSKVKKGKSKPRETVEEPSHEDLPYEDIEEEILEPLDQPFKQSAVYWTIQVGSFSDKGLAQLMTKRMATYSRHVTLERADELYRVRVGKFLLRTDADELATHLKRDGVPTWVTSNE